MTSASTEITSVDATVAVWTLLVLIGASVKKVSIATDHIVLVRTLPSYTIVVFSFLKLWTELQVISTATTVDWWFSKRILIDLLLFLFSPDLNECQGGHNCDVNAWCTNTSGSYRCFCKKGYRGNGMTCERRGTFHILSKFSTLN